MKQWVYSIYIILFWAGWIVNSALAAQEAPVPKISGYMFGDYYWIVTNHRSDLEGRNGFWFRRIYFTVDESLNETWAIRFRLELNSPGDFRSRANLTPYVKDAYLRWKGGRHEVYFGISPTPTWEVIEALWGYRSVEKTPLDLQRMGTARDFGVAARGSLDKGRKFRYHLMIGNGLGTEGADVDKGKKGFLSLGFYPDDRWVVEVYGDWEDRPGSTDRWTWQAFLAYRTPQFRAGLQYAHQTRQGSPNTHLNVGSVFLVVQPTSAVALLARYDRMFDPNPEGDRIAYIPLDPTAKSNLIVAGVDFRLHARVHLIPNIEYVWYDTPPAGSRPKSDLFLRGTVFFEF